MAAIGAITVLTMQGRPVGPAPFIEAVERTGRHGAEYRDIGQRETPVQIRTIQTAADDATAAAAAAANEALRGTIVTVTDAWAVATTNCLIAEVQTAIRATNKPSNAPTDTRRIETVWTVRALYVAP